MKKISVVLFAGLMSVNAFAFDSKVVEINQIVAPGGSPGGVGIGHAHSKIAVEVKFCRGVSAVEFNTKVTQNQNYQVLIIAPKGPMMDCRGPKHAQIIELTTEALVPYKPILIGNSFPVNVR